MTIGILPNTSKENIEKVVALFAGKLREKGFRYFVNSEMLLQGNYPAMGIPSDDFLPLDELCKKSDMVVSIGGDGTMLHTAYLVRNYDTPILGVNFGKLGFLAEFDMNRMDIFLDEIKKGEYTIEERIVLEGECLNCAEKELFAINDIVIDKGGWPKMIEISVRVNGDYVTTFSADGLILATPTGSTGYSLSVGGPVVSPQADVITLSPISAHSLTIRPLVISSSHRIYLNVSSQHPSVQVNCDGQRVYSYPSPMELVVYKSPKSIKLVHTNSTNYFKILREKLFWGMDVRKRI